jgi:hypothetical protein
VCGVCALLALDREDRPGDVVATVLLLASLLFSDVGIPFVAAATVDLALRRDRWARAYVVAGPTALWLLWYAGWGHEAHTFVSFTNFAKSPGYILDGLSASLATWLGLGASASDPSPLDWGQPLLVLALGLVAWRLYVLRRPSPRLLGTAALLLGFWFLTALNTNPLAPPTAGRYQYLGIVLLVLVVAELVRGLRMGQWVIVGALLVSVAAALTNGVRLRDAAHGLAGIAQQQRGGLAALELTRGHVAPGFKLTQENSGVEYLGALDAGSYFSAIDAYGSPAYTPTELAGSSELARTSADMVFAAALGVRLLPAPGLRPGGCVTAKPATPVTVPRAGLLLRSGRPGVQASLRRYATASFPVSLGALEPRVPELLRITPDRSAKPWTLELSAPASVCQP